MITQLNPQIPVFVVSKSMKARAIGWIDYSAEDDLYWICALDDGEIWIAPQHEIRMQYNWTLGRRKGD